MPEIREVFEMTTKQMEPDVDAWRDQERHQRRAVRNKRLGAFAVVAAIGTAAIAVSLGTRGGQDATTPAQEPQEPAATAAEEVATRFVVAFGEFDADRALAYLADDVDLSELDARTVERLPLQLSLLEAMGYEQMLTSCDETGSTESGTSVRCTFDFHAIRSHEIGLGPYGGSFFDLTVRDGEIGRVSLHWQIADFSPQVWEPFAEWVSTTYPEDAAAMLTENYDNFLLTRESIRLWEQRTREYVAVETPDRRALHGGSQRLRH